MNDSRHDRLYPHRKSCFLPPVQRAALSSSPPFLYGSTLDLSSSRLSRTQRWLASPLYLKYAMLGLLRIVSIAYQGMFPY